MNNQALGLTGLYITVKKSSRQPQIKKYLDLCQTFVYFFRKSFLSSIKS